MRKLGPLFARLLIKEGKSACSSRSVSSYRSHGSSHLFAKKTKSTHSNNQSKLAKASKALVEAESLEVGSESQKQLVAKIDTLCKEVATMKGQLSTMRVIQEKERMDKRIIRAMDLTNMESFKYYDENSGPHGFSESSYLAESALKRFLLGYNFLLPAEATMTRVGRLADDYEIEESRREVSEADQESNPTPASHSERFRW